MLFDVTKWDWIDQFALWLEPHMATMIIGFVVNILAMIVALIVKMLFHSKIENSLWRQVYKISSGVFIIFFFVLLFGIVLLIAPSDLTTVLFLLVVLGLVYSICAKHNDRVRHIIEFYREITRVVKNREIPSLAEEVVLLKANAKQTKDPNDKIAAIEKQRELRRAVKEAIRYILAALPRGVSVVIGSKRTDFSHQVDATIMIPVKGVSGAQNELKIFHVIGFQTEEARKRLWDIFDGFPLERKLCAAEVFKAKKEFITYDLYRQLKGRQPSDSFRHKGLDFDEYTIRDAIENREETYVLEHGRLDLSAKGTEPDIRFYGCYPLLKNTGGYVNEPTSIGVLNMEWKPRFPWWYVPHEVRKRLSELFHTVASVVTMLLDVACVHVDESILLERD